MNPQSRLELYVDVFDQTSQRALALPDLLPGQLVGAVLQEFRELEFLGDDAADYQLLRAADRTPLEMEAPLGHQVQSKERLLLVEREAPLPEGTRRPAWPIYLREQRTGKAYRLPWQPAIIGRVSENQPMNEWVAVDLSGYGTGLRVSRRHVMIVEERGQHFMEIMSSNPVSLIRNNREETVSATYGTHPLLHGDLIRLDRSGITLKFIVRQPQSAGSAQKVAEPELA
jgi:hypothetical protein